jgi:hypothetical protein
MTKPKSLAERLEWMAANLPGFQDELNAVEVSQQRALLAKNCHMAKRAAHRPAQESRRLLLQCIADCHQFSDHHEFVAPTLTKRTHIATIAGLTAASYLDDLGGLLAVW